MHTHYTDPGYVTAQLLEHMDDAMQDALEQSCSDKRVAHLSVHLPSCRRCKQRKPFRAHHCSFCNRCVLKMGASCTLVRT